MWSLGRLAVVCLVGLAFALSGCAASKSPALDSLASESALALGEPVQIGAASVRIPEGWRRVSGNKAFWREPGEGNARAEMAVGIVRGKPEGVAWSTFWEELREETVRNLAEDHELRDEGTVALGSLQAFAMKFYRASGDKGWGVRMYMVGGVAETYVLSFAMPWERFDAYDKLFRRSAESISVQAHDGAFRRRVQIGDATVLIPEGWSRSANEPNAWLQPDGKANMRVIIGDPKPPQMDNTTWWEQFASRYKADLPPGVSLIDETTLKISRFPAYMLRLRHRSSDGDIGLTMVVVSTEAHVYLLTYGASWEAYDDAHQRFIQSAATFDME